MNKTKILFIGTGSFAVPILQGLLDSDFIDVVGVVTQPDKPVGRKQELQGGPVKRFIESSKEGEVVDDLRIYQPGKLREESKGIIATLKPELVVVASYGQMIPDNILNEPKFGAINIHGSLLPKLRGAVPVPMAILQGLEMTGVTIQKVVKGMDEGPVYSKKEIKIHPSDTTESLMVRLAEVGRVLTTETLQNIINDDLSPEKQDELGATYCYMSDIAKDKAKITYETPVEAAERMVRAFIPWPIAWLTISIDGVEKRVKVFKASIPDETVEVAQGVFGIKRFEKRLFLSLQNGLLEIEELQLEGKQRREALEYLYLAT